MLYRDESGYLVLECKNEEFYINDCDELDLSFGSRVFACINNNDIKSVYLFKRRENYKQELDKVLEGMPNFDNYDKFKDYQESIDRSKITAYLCSLNKSE